MISAELLRSTLDYSPESGEFTWRFSRKGVTLGRAGYKAGGYVYICLYGKRYAAQDLAWLYVTGEWPIEIDHRDLDGLNNRFTNLRNGTRSQNHANQRRRRDNTSGVKGVTWDAAKGKWMVQIKKDRRNRFLGYFSSLDDAAACRRQAAETIFGEFARHE